MNSQVTAVRGMKDLFGEELSQWKFVEEKIHAIFKTFGFSEIRTPALVLAIGGLFRGNDQLS
jgi:histidyl-tRNA synthetase